MRPRRGSAEDISHARLTPAGWTWYVGGGEWIPAPHLLLCADRIAESCEHGGYLLVEMPVRHGKSVLISRGTPGWYMGKYPDRQVIVCSSTKDMAQGWVERARIDFETYGPEVWGLTVDRRAQAKSFWRVDGHPEGGVRAAGTGTKLSGRGADLLITDDLIPGIKEARSDVTPESIWEWTQSVALRRLQPGSSAHVGVMTRWRVGDVHDRLRETNPRYETLRLPALAEDDDPLGRARGEPLWPTRWSLERLEEIRQTMPTYLWSALYQQRPSPEEGGLWRAAWWRSCSWDSQDGKLLRLSDGYTTPVENCVRFAVVDLATSERETADFTVILACALTNESPRRLLLLDCDRRRMDAPEIPHSVSRMMARWGLSVAYFEEQGNQKWGSQYARQHGIPCRTIGTAKDSDVRIPGDKVAAAYAVGPYAASGMIVPPAAAAWRADWEHELLTFPQGEHDDLADVTAWACHIARGVGGSLLVGARPRPTPEDEYRKTDEERRREKAEPTRWAPKPARRRDVLKDYGLNPP